MLTKNFSSKQSKILQPILLDISKDRCQKRGHLAILGTREGAKEDVVFSVQQAGKIWGRPGSRNKKRIFVVCE